MTPDEINAFLTLAKTDQTEVANKLGLDRTQINKAINGPREVAAHQTSIASLFGMTRDEFFGEDHAIAIRAKQIDELGGKGTVRRMLDQYLRQHERGKTSR
jgi:plasmid maintenance system antidote protein VapI